MADQSEINLIEAFAGELWQATMIQNILEDNQIKVFLENELMGTIAPWRVSAGGFNPVKVIVSSADYDQAIKIIEDFNKSEFVDEEE
ncbi:nicotinic acid phosphoribosyltransferase [Pedobacter sp. UYP24]